MQTIPKHFLEEIRNRLRLSEIIAPKVKLTRAGREFKACCPFHHEKSPSFYINDEKGFFHCFGCGAHGDHIGFLMRHSNMPFMEAVEQLAAQAGLSVPKPSVQDIERAARGDRLVGAVEEATKFFTSALFDGRNKEILAYLTTRGVNDETIHAFRLGYAPDDAQALRKHLAAKGYNDAEMLDAGLIKKSTRGGGQDYFAFFRDRVIFPVTDRRGRPIAFGGRVLPEKLRPLAPGMQKPPKYINSSDTHLFQKGHVLYNESNARAAAGKDQPVIVCEGYADVISLWQAGFPGAVAPLGTALTEHQIASLWKMIPDEGTQDLRAPYLCFDGDAAGTRAALRSLERILPMLEPGLTARFVFLPDGLDPDDLIRQRGKAAFEAALDEALSLSDMLWRNLTEGRSFTTPEAKAGLLKAIETTCARIPDRTVQTQFVAGLKDKFYQTFNARQARGGSGQGYGAGKFGSGKYGGNGKSGGGKSGKPMQPPVALPDPKMAVKLARVRIALAAVINFPEIYHDAEEMLGTMDVPDSGVDALRQAVITVLSDDHDWRDRNFAEHLCTGGHAEQVALAMQAALLHGRFALNGSDPVKALHGLRDVVSRAG